MEQAEIIAGNKLIAEFMGLKLEVANDHGGKEYEWIPAFKHSNWCFETPPPFSERWDWLMPVVEKIYLLREVDAFDMSPGSAQIG